MKPSIYQIDKFKLIIPKTVDVMGVNFSFYNFLTIESNFI